MMNRYYLFIPKHCDPWIFSRVYSYYYLFKILPEQYGERFIKGRLGSVVSDEYPVMPEIDVLGFLLCSNNDPDMWRYALFGIENKDVQLALTCFLNNRMIHGKIIGDESYRFIYFNILHYS